MIRLTAALIALIVAAPAAAQTLEAGATAALQPYNLPPISCTQRATKASAILCRTSPGATLELNGAPVALADNDGLAVVAIPRTHSGAATVSVSPPVELDIPYDPAKLRVAIEIDPRDDPVSRFKMQCGKIAPQDPAAQRHASQAWLKKQEALKIFAQPVAPVGFTKPANGRYSSPYGGVRTYIPDGDCEGRTSVHNGLDIAVPTGTPVNAPMAGTVILADPDLFYEGGCVFLDHGRGMISVLMHLSRIDVEAGDVVGQGEQLGLSGATGRVTGAHLHWAIKYRNEFSDDRGTDQWLDPTLMLALSEDMLPAN